MVTTATLRQACRVLERAIDNLDEAQTLHKYDHDPEAKEDTVRERCQVNAAAEALRHCLENHHV
jgi:hypothetical protein